MKFTPIKLPTAARSLSLTGLLSAVVFSSAATTVAQAAPAPSCATADPAGSLSARSLDGVSVEECNLVGETVAAGDLRVRVPAPGDAVTAHSVVDATSGDVGETLRVEVTKRGIASVTRGGEAEAAAAAVAACDETSYSTTGLGSWNQPIRWRVNVSSVPTGDISQERALGSLRSGMFNMVSGRNTCGLADPVSVTQRNVGETSRSPRIGTGCLGRDQVNVVGFGSVSGSNTLAVACTYGSGGNIVEADMIFSTSKSWTPWGNSPGCSGEFDLKGVATHEFGHWLGLGHSDGPHQTMYPSIGSCDVSTRTLGRGDILGLRALY